MSVRRAYRLTFIIEAEAEADLPTNELELAFEIADGLPKEWWSPQDENDHSLVEIRPTEEAS